MATKNDITGDEIKTGVNSEAFRSGWERIFGNKNSGEESGKEGDSREEDDRSPSNEDENH